MTGYPQNQWNEDSLREGLYRHDEAALEAVSHRYGRLLYGLANRIVGSPPDAEKCVNDALLDLWNAVPPDRPQRILAYVSVLVRRRAVDRVCYKTASRRGGEEYEGSMEELAGCLSDPDGESTLEALAIRDCLERFLRTLSEEDRTVFTLRYFACFSNAEIGEKCGFILFANGTWGEYEIHDGCFEDCHGDGCPAGSEDDYPHALTKGCRITLTDGRIFELVEQEIDGSMMYVPVPISELTA